MPATTEVPGLRKRVVCEPTASDSLQQLGPLKFGAKQPPNRLPDVESDTSTPKHRIPSLDGLRAVAVSLVVLCHVGYGTYVQANSWAGFVIAPIGLFGVRIFFCISGFLITSLLMQELRDSGRIDLRRFYVRRCFRILPAAYVFMVICFLCFHALPLRDKVLSALFLDNYSNNSSLAVLPVAHLWSLGVEEQFYLLWPVLFALLPKRRITLLTVTLVVVPCLNVIDGYFGDPIARGGFPFVADGLACGCLLALLWQNPKLQSLLRNHWFVLIPIITVVAMPFSQADGPLAFRFVKSLLLRPGLNIGIALTVGKAVQMSPRFLNWRLLTTVGVWSYSLYLWQEPFRSGPSWTGSLALDLPLRLAAMFLCAIASYRFIEQPFLTLRQRFLSASRKSAKLRRPRSASVLFPKPSTGVQRG